MRRSLPIFYSTLMLTAVNLLLRFVSTSFQVFISARIGPEGIGLLQLVLSVGTLSLTAGMAGVRTATMYLTAEELGKRKPQNITWILRGCFLYSISISTAVALILHSAAPYIAHHWIGNMDTVNAIRIYACFLPIVCLTGCMTGYFTGANRIITLAGIEIIEQLCYMVITMVALLLWAENNAQKACAAIVLGSGISSSITLVLLLWIRMHHRPKSAPRLSVRKRLAHLAVPLALGDNLKVGINTVENLMVPKRLALYPLEAAPLGTFGTVVGMVFPILMFPAAILYALAELLIPELARCNAEGSSRRIRYLVRKSIRLSALYGFLCAGILYLTAEPLCLHLYNNHDAGKYLRIYSLLIPMLYCDAITDAMIKGLGQQAVSVRYNILTSLMDVTFLFLLLPKYGMRGYFLSFLITHFINFCLSIRRLLFISRVRLTLLSPFILLTASMVATQGATLLSSSVQKILAYVIILGCLLVLFRVIGKADFIWMKKLIANKNYSVNKHAKQVHVFSCE